MVILHCFYRVLTPYPKERNDLLKSTTDTVVDVLNFNSYDYLLLNLPLRKMNNTLSRSATLGLSGEAQSMVSVGSLKLWEKMWDIFQRLQVLNSRN